MTKFTKRNKVFLKRKIMPKSIFRKGISAANFVLLYLKEIGSWAFDFFSSEPGERYLNLKFWKRLLELSPEEKWTKTTFQSVLSRLKQQGLIECDSKKRVYFLTEKGKELAGYIKDRYSILQKPWDRQIRIVIFDIPEKKRVYRDWLRSELSLLEFKPLQKSVYIGKYPLPQSLIEEIDRCNIAQNVFIFTVKEISREKEVMKLLEE